MTMFMPTPVLVAPTQQVAPCCFVFPAQQDLTSWGVAPSWQSSAPQPTLVPVYNAVDRSAEQTMVQAMQPQYMDGRSGRLWTRSEARGFVEVEVSCTDACTREPESPQHRTWPVSRFTEFAKDVHCGMVAERVADDAMQQKFDAMVAEAAVVCEDNFMDENPTLERNQISDFAAVSGLLPEEDPKSLKKAFFAKMLYKTTLCQHFLTGLGCRKGLDCGYAHGAQELRDAAAQKAMVRNAVPCDRGDRCLRLKPKKGDNDCPFWHKEDDVALNPILKTMGKLTVCPVARPPSTGATELAVQEQHLVLDSARGSVGS